MISLDQHLLSFLIRWIHVISMAFLLGGALLGTALASLNTLVGVFIFAVFWVTTWAVSHQTLKGAGQSIAERQISPLRTRRLFLRGGFYGGLNGFLFLVLGSLIFAAILLAGSTQPRDLATFLQAGIAYLFAVGVGGGFAFIIGALVGVAFVAIDFVLLMVSRVLFSLIRESSAAPAG